MKVYSIFWRPKAEDDLLAIVRFIAEDNPARALSFGAEIKEKTGGLSTMPARCRRGHVPGTRELIVHENYLVIFRIAKSKVTILRIKHTALKESANPEKQ